MPLRLGSGLADVQVALRIRNGDPCLLQTLKNGGVQLMAGWQSVGEFADENVQLEVERTVANVEKVGERLRIAHHQRMLAGAPQQDPLYFIERRSVRDPDPEHDPRDLIG